MRRRLYEDEHEQFRASFRRFLAEALAPRYDEFERAGIIDREVFRAAGRHGFLGLAVPEAYGGAGVADFRFNAVIGEEVMRAGFPSFGITLHNDVCLPYFLELADGAQRERWLPGIASGELITAIAMTEPGAGSDLAALATRAQRDGDAYVVNGSKTFITNGVNGDLVIAAVKTDPTAGRDGISLLVVERGMEGFERGRNLEKIGMHAQDTAELFFTDLAVPVANRLGAEGQGFAYLRSNLAQERLSIAIAGLAGAEAALATTLEYVGQRTAFGRSIGSFQHSRFALAEMRTEIDVAQAFVDECVRALDARELSGADAAKAKWWCTELHGRVVDRCVQLHGGYGYMQEYPIARNYVDARITRIYGGANEIMKEIVARSLTPG